MEQKRLRKWLAKEIIREHITFFYYSISMKSTNAVPPYFSVSERQVSRYREHLGTLPD